MDKIITPNALRICRKQCKEAYANARKYIAQCRAEREAARGRPYLLECADAWLVVAENCRSDAREIQRYLRTVTVEKYCNLSPNAARREASRRGTVA